MLPTARAEAPRTGWRAPPWLSGAVLPFLVTRAALLVVAGAAERLPFARGTDLERARGWVFSPHRLLDVFGRWDTAWYLSVARDGYHHTPGAAVGAGQENLAFFPLYPLAVRGLHALLPRALQGGDALLALMVALSNACALAAMVLLHRHVAERFRDEALAARAVLYALAFPTAFFLACAYTEAAFLLLALLAWHLAWRGRWLGAGLAGAALALLRPNGVLALVPLAWLAVRSAGDARTRLARLAPLALVPAAFLGWAAWLGWFTGDPLAVVHVQRAWGRGFGWPWQTLVHTRRMDGMTDFDRVLVVLVCGGLAFMPRLLSGADALWTAVMLAPILFSGTLTSASRLLATVFPFFVLLGKAGRSAAFERAYLALALFVQALLFVWWSRAQWVG